MLEAVEDLFSGEAPLTSRRRPASAGAGSLPSASGTFGATAIWANVSWPALRFGSRMPPVMSFGAGM